MIPLQCIHSMTGFLRNCSKSTPSVFTQVPKQFNVSFDILILLAMISVSFCRKLTATPITAQKSV